MTDAELIAAHYRPWTVRLYLGRACPTLKLGPLSLYVYSHGIGWTWFCGRGHELLWRPL